MEVYEVVKSIGSGSFGQVYLVKHKREDKLYVVKKIKTRDMQTKDREATEQEVRLLQKLRHTNIVAYKDSYLDQDQFLNIVMVYCEGGDMYNKIRNCKGKNFPETQVLDWFAQMALALYYLHEQKILHRDLKTQNIFLKHGRVRLGDFGIAKVLDSTRDFANTCIGTPYYMSPELFKYKPYSYKSDVWALGCVMYEICNLRHAFDAQSFQGLAVKIIKGSYPPITPTYSKQLRDLIGKMLSLNPKDRPTIVDVLNKPIIKRRVVNYMSEIFMGKYPEASLPNDVDDIYIDSLREQAESLGIMHYIQENIAKGDTPEKMFDMGEENVKEAPVDKKGMKAIRDEMKENKKALKQAVEEKENIEKELEKLEKKEKDKKVPAKGPKNRNFSQEKIKKVNQLKPEDIKEKFNEDPGSNREANKREGKAIIRKAHSKDTRAPDSKSTAAKTETSTESKVEERIPRLGQKEADNASKKSHFVQKDKDFVMEEEEKQRDKNKQNNRKSSAENIRSMDDLDDEEEQPQPQSKNAALSYHKQRILLEKEKKRKEEQQRMERQLQQIRQDNYEALRLANEKRRAQYRPSDDMVSMLNIGPGGKPVGGFSGQYNTTSSGFGTVNERETLNSVESRENLRAVEEGNRSDEKRGNQEGQQQNFKIQEEYGMNDEIEDDEEEENKIIEEEHEEEEEDEHLREIREKINKYKDKLKEKTMKISELKQTLKKTMLKEKTMKTSSQLPRVDSEEDMKLSPSDNDVEDYSDAFDVDEIGEDDDSTEENTNAHESEIQEKKSFHPQYYKIQDRIKLLKYRCEAGIGNALYEKAYRYLNEKTTAQNQEEIRKHLIDILGEENIGFWHLIDQILLFEGFARKFQEAC